MFGAARLEAENAVEAANAYKELLAVLKEAREFAQNASTNANEAKEFIVGQVNICFYSPFSMLSYELEYAILVVLAGN